MFDTPFHLQHIRGRSRPLIVLFYCICYVKTTSVLPYLESNHCVGIKFAYCGAWAAVMQILRLLVETLGIFRVRICVCALASNPDLFSKINRFGNSLREDAN